MNWFTSGSLSKALEEVTSAADVLNASVIVTRVIAVTTQDGTHRIVTEVDTFSMPTQGIGAPQGDPHRALGKMILVVMQGPNTTIHMRNSQQ